ncbi:MAG: MNIO family bufferin maturase, partial [Myxococcota bacterium]
MSFGAGFRTPYADEIARSPGALDWLEVVTENVLGIGGARRAMLDRVRADHPIALHGVSLSIAGTDPLDDSYLRDLRALADRVEPRFVSDHLCWTALAGRQSHDLLPIAFTGGVLDHVCARVARVQEVLGRRLTLENASVYVAFRGDELGEAEFFRELCRRTGCGILLDVNNLYVNAQNLGLDLLAYLASLPRESVDYLHLAGHAVLPDVRIDTHAADVALPVWELFDVAARHFPEADVIVERDDDLPPFAELCAEVERARERHARAREAPVASLQSEPPRPVIASPSSSTAWRSQQARLWQQIVAPGDADPELLVDGRRPVTAVRGTRVYSDAYRTNLRRALAVNFPALARVVDPDDWSALCAAYLHRHPPRGHDF